MIRILSLGLKRGLDICASAMALVLLSPVIVTVAVLVWLKLGSPIFFGQPRPGLHGRPFQLVKFRTMTDRRDPAGALLPDADRLTAFGRWLRSTSLDELPALWNVLRGDMSLVGPRPLLVRYLPLYTREQSRRHDVRPGITGWAQISGRNALSWEQKFALDLWYIDHWSLWLDFHILFRTFFSVVSRDGISADGEATMAEFLGSEDRPMPSVNDRSGRIEH